MLSLNVKDFFACRWREIANLRNQAAIKRGLVGQTEIRLSSAHPKLGRSK